MTSLHTKIKRELVSVNLHVINVFQVRRVNTDRVEFCQNSGLELRRINLLICKSDAVRRSDQIRSRIPIWFGSYISKSEIPVHFTLTVDNF